MHLQPDGASARAPPPRPRWDADGGHLSPAGSAATWRAPGRGRSPRSPSPSTSTASPRPATGTPTRGGARRPPRTPTPTARPCGRAGRGPAGAAGHRDGLARPTGATRSPRSSTRRPFDVVLGSVHWLGPMVSRRPRRPPTGAGGPAEEVWSAYLAELVAAAESGLFDVLAHPDLPKVFGARMPGVLEDRPRRGRRGRSPRRASPSSAPRPACASRCASSTRSPACWRASARPACRPRCRATPTPRGRRPRLPHGRRRPARRRLRDHHPLLAPPGRSRSRSDGHEDRLRALDAHRFGPGRPLMLGTVAVPITTRAWSATPTATSWPTRCATPCWPAAGQPDLGALFPPGDAGVGRGVGRAAARRS